MKDIKPFEWLERGYKRWEIPKGSEDLYKLADFFLQKAITDNLGKKYFITVYVYDRKQYPNYSQDKPPEFSYMATVQFVLYKNGPIFDISLSYFDSIPEVESRFESLWHYFNKPYYEKWN